MDQHPVGWPQRVEGRGVDFLHPLWSCYHGMGRAGGFTGPPGWGAGHWASIRAAQLRSGSHGSEGLRGHLTPGHIIPVQEGANINKSLTTLGKVISALAEMVSEPRVLPPGGRGGGGGRWECPLSGRCPFCGAGPTEKPQSVGTESPAGGGARILSFPGACETRTCHLPHGP